ncbi:hypothetical protein HYW17_02000 [Candidatus Uhrbacteria bacterium]|nr:hypothetical protein [Candidatus Uhrbacteria bacterium]
MLEHREGEDAYIEELRGRATESIRSYLAMNAGIPNDAIPDEIIKRGLAEMMTQLRASSGKRTETMPKLGNVGGSTAEVRESVEAGTPTEILTGWRAFFNAEKGRYQNDIKKLEQELRSKLGDRLVSIRPDYSQPGVAQIQVRVGQRMRIFGVPLHSLYSNFASHFEADDKTNLMLAEVDDLLEAAEFEDGEVKKRGLVRVSVH